MEGTRFSAPLEHRTRNFAEAAWRLEDTLETPEDEVLKYPEKIIEARQANFEACRAQLHYVRALIGLIVLSMFETPTWCHREASLFELNTRCGASVSSEVVLSGVPYIPVGYGVIIELVLLMVMTRKFLMQRSVQTTYFENLEPKQDYYPLAYVNVGLALVAFQVVDCAAFVIYRPNWRLSFLARFGLLCLLPQIIKLAKLVYSCLWEFFSIAVFLIGIILIFTWISVTLFKNLEGGTEGFETFSEALNSMFVSGVSADFYTVMLKSYTAHRWVGLIWLAFLVIVHVLFLALVLDTLVAAYMNYSEKGAEDVAQKKVMGILKSFRTLHMVTKNMDANHPDEILKEDLLEFLQVYGSSPRSVPISPQTAELMYTAIDKDGNGFIDYQDFCGICKVIQTRLKTTRRDSIIATRYPDLWDSPNYKKFRAFVVGAGDIQSIHDEGEDDEEEDTANDHPGFDRLMTVVLIVNLLLVVLETSYDLNNVKEPAYFDYLELLFSFVYLGEVAIKLAVISFEEYWSLGSNRFDLFSTILLLAASVAERLFSGNISTYANIFRLLRLFRVIKNLKKIPSVHFMVTTITKLLEAAKDMVTLLGVIMFFFTMLSVQLSGGQLHGGDKRLEGTEYMETHLFALNFNDFFSAFGIWFCMLLQEYNPTFPDAVSKVQTTPVTWLMFPVFYLCGVSITFELVKAFTIEVFVALYKERGASHSDHHESLYEQCMNGLARALKKQGQNLHFSSKGTAEEQHLFTEALEELEHHAEAQGKTLLHIVGDDKTRSAPKSRH